VGTSRVQQRDARVTSPVEVLWVARYDYEPGWQVRSHAHNHHQMILTLDGAGAFRAGGQTIRTQAGDLLFLPPRCQHGLCTSRQPLRTLDIKFRILDAALARACRALPRHVRAPKNLEDLLEAVRTEGLAQRPQYRAFCDHYLGLAVLELLRQHAGTSVAPLPPTPHASPAPVGQPEVARVAAFIAAHCHEPLTREQLAALARCSYRYLCELFQRELRIAPMQYVRRCRIDRARELASRSEFELKQIATLTGFKSVHHFTRIFQQETGLPPARWRAQERTGIRRDVVIAPGFANEDRTLKP